MFASLLVAQESSQPQEDVESIQNGFSSNVVRLFHSVDSPLSHSVVSELPQGLLIPNCAALWHIVETIFLARRSWEREAGVSDISAVAVIVYSEQGVGENW